MSLHISVISAILAGVDDDVGKLLVAMVSLHVKSQTNLLPFFQVKMYMSLGLLLSTLETPTGSKTEGKFAEAKIRLMRSFT